MSQYSRIEISSDLKTAISAVKLPKDLGFGQVELPLMATCHYQDGKWGELELKAYEAVSLNPSAKCLHYGQLIFEGMKCYRNANGHLALFRPLVNWQRFNSSAQRLCMPEISQDIFMQSIESYCYHLRDLVPSGEGESLYLRPFMIATAPGLGLAAAQGYTYMLIGAPSGNYFGTDRVKVLIEREDCRAAPGGDRGSKGCR